MTCPTAAWTEAAMAAPLQPDGTGRVVDYVVAAGLDEAAFRAAIDDGAGSGACGSDAEILGWRPAG